MLTARDLMTEAPSVVDATSTLRTALERLQALDIRHLPVVDSDGVLVGMISDRDLRGAHVGELRAPLDTAVASIMSANVVAVDEDADVAEIVDIMLDYKIGAVPVIDADKSLVGIVSYIDLLRTLSLEAAE